MPPTRSRSGTETRRGLQGRSFTEDLVDDILAIAPELDGPSAAEIARQFQPERAVSARQVADHLGLSKTDWVYANAARLGGRRLGEGKGARWRFYLSEVDECLCEFGGRPAEPSPVKAATKSQAPRRGKRRPGVTASGNALLDFEAA
jgi:hypothetical protein